MVCLLVHPSHASAMQKGLNGSMQPSTNYLATYLSTDLFNQVIAVSYIKQNAGRQCADATEAGVSADGGHT